MTTAEAVKLEAKVRMPATLRALKNYRHLTDRKIAELAGTNHAKVNGHLTGRHRTNECDVAGFALAFGVPSWVLMLEPIEALRWALDNAPNPEPTASDLRKASSARVVSIDRLFNHATAA